MGYKDWVFLTATARNDWSSTLNKNGEIGNSGRSFFYSDLSGCKDSSKIPAPEVTSVPLIFPKFTSAPSQAHRASPVAWVCPKSTTCKTPSDSMNPKAFCVYQEAALRAIEAV